MKKYLKSIKNEKGSFTIFSLFIIIAIIAIVAVFINVSMTYMTISSAKKSLEESTRTRALAVDVVLKEHAGVIEVMHTPYEGNPNMAYSNPSVDLFDNTLPQPGSTNYVEAVEEAEYFAKMAMSSAVSGLSRDGLDGETLVELSFDNICFDVKPLPEDDGYVQFACALKDEQGNVFTVKSLQLVKGYNDSLDINHFEDTTLQESAERDINVSNVVFGAAMIEPKSFIVRALSSLGVAKDPQITIYSVAYPQIDECYGEFCN